MRRTNAALAETGWAAALRRSGGSHAPSRSHPGLTRAHPRGNIAFLETELARARLARGASFVNQPRTFFPDQRLLQSGRRFCRASSISTSPVPIIVAYDFGHLPERLVLEADHSFETSPSAKAIASPAMSACGAAGGMREAGGAFADPVPGFCPAFKCSRGWSHWLNVPTRRVGAHRRIRWNTGSAKLGFHRRRRVGNRARDYGACAMNQARDVYRDGACKGNPGPRRLGGAKPDLINGKGSGAP